MSESKEAHKIRMRLKRSHPDWTNEMIRNEIKRELKSSQKVHKRFTESSQNQEKESSQKFTKSSQRELSTEINAPERFILSYSRNKYQFTLYRLIEGKKILEGSKTKHEEVQFKNAIVELTWGPDPSETQEPEIESIEKKGE